MNANINAVRADRQKLVQVVQNFFSKCAQVVAQARAAPLPEGTGKINKWFNLEMDDLERLRDDLKPWRIPNSSSAGFTSDDAFSSHSSSFPPLVIECYVDPRKLGPGQAMVVTDVNGKSWGCTSNSTAAGSMSSTAAKEVVIERWIIELRPSESNDLDTELPVVYKQAIIAIRALYSVVRLLPAWQLRQRLVRQKFSTVPLSLGIRVLNGNHPISSRGRIGLSKPIGPPTSGLGQLQQYQLAPLHTPLGTLIVGVSYRKNVQFDVEDAEKVLAQQFLELDLTGPTKAGPVATPTSPSTQIGDGTSFSCGSMSSSKKPTLSFTRPFRSPDPNHSAASLTPGATGATGATGAAGSASGSAPGSAPRAIGFVSGGPVTSQQHSTFGHSQSPHTQPTSSVVAGSAVTGSASVGTSTSLNINPSAFAFKRTPSASSISRAYPQSVPVPVPRGSPSGSVSSSVSSHRFSSSFASRNQTVPRSTDSRIRPMSITSNASGPYIGSASGAAGVSSGASAASATSGVSLSLASSLEPGSGLYVAHEDACDFVRYVDDTQKRASSAFKGRVASPTSLDTSLQRFQNLRSSHTQLSDSIVASTTLRPSISRASNASNTSSSHSLEAHARTQQEFSRRRRSSARRRLSFYSGDDSNDHESPSAIAGGDDGSDDDHELLFAMSDMHG